MMTRAAAKRAANSPTALIPKTFASEPAPIQVATVVRAKSIAKVRTIAGPKRATREENAAASQDGRNSHQNQNMPIAATMVPIA